MNYEEAMKYILEVGNFGSSYGLSRTFRILEILDNPQKELKLIHVAGTNGKGSVTSMVTSLLMEYGFKVGMYTSPFLESFEERIQINRKNIPKEKLAELISKVKVSVDKVIGEGYNHPTEFEIITCLMLLYFKEEEIDYAVIEVGLGGRLDSTNVITPILSIITSISYDHTNILGNLLEDIAFEKAGIIKEKIPVILYPQRKEVLEVIQKVSKEKESKIICVNEEDVQLIDIISKEKIYQRVKVNVVEKELYINLPLLGQHQMTNLLVAIRAFIEVINLQKLRFSEDIIKKGIQNVTWIGRLEVMSKNPLVVIDGAHNIQGIKTLKKNIKKYFKYKNIYLLLGILADKQVNEMIEEIAPMATKIYALTPQSDRAKLSEDLKMEVIKVNKNCISLNSYKEAYSLALSEASKDDLIIVSGSLYMIGDMRKIIKKWKET